jgi:hypothetical protein
VKLTRLECPDCSWTSTSIDPAYDDGSLFTDYKRHRESVHHVTPIRVDWEQEPAK